MPCLSWLADARNRGVRGSGPPGFRREPDATDRASRRCAVPARGGPTGCMTRQSAADWPGPDVSRTAQVHHTTGLRAFGRADASCTIPQGRMGCRRGVNETTGSRSARRVVWTTVWVAGTDQLPDLVSRDVLSPCRARRRGRPAALHNPARRDLPPSRANLSLTVMQTWHAPRFRDAITGYAAWSEGSGPARRPQDATILAARMKSVAICVAGAADHDTPPAPGRD
jgi:hypothetical protein